MLIENFKKKMNKKYGMYGEFDFNSMIFKSSKTTLKCNKCGIENTKSAIRHISCTCSNCYSNMSQRSNNDDFILKVEKKFGTEKFKFDKLVYVNAKTPVTIFCTKHNGYFHITPNKLLTGAGCNVCNINVVHTNNEFIKIVKRNYGDKFSFQKTNYINRTTKVTVHCNEGNHDWEVDPKTLILGKSGCGICSGKGGRTTEQFIAEAVKVHNNNYDYSSVMYEHSEKMVEIKCNNCKNIFHQQPKAHLTGRGCPTCGKYGYQTSKPGYFYVQKLTNKDKTVYKYGITGDMKRRVNEQSRDSEFVHEVLVERFFEDGNKPLLLEKFIKQYIESGVVSTEELPSGFTETFDAKYLESVLEIVNTFK
ncbi:hypothetical protein QPL51_03265 [Escherichia coli]|uniref:hypothetical protein n=1 Tax=Escherichia coli TaxID=562 RepID=UPI00287B04D7|nr:hypothetical protein [Escherichia coli]MDS1552055.1 hypothetical protein [Escherichia coli]